MFLIALFTVGCGASILETAANPFIAQFGPAETSEQRLNFAQSFNPPGTITGVIDWNAISSFRVSSRMTPEIAQMKVAGTYQAICTRRSCAWCRRTWRLARWCCCLRCCLSRMKFPSMHGGA